MTFIHMRMKKKIGTTRWKFILSSTSKLRIDLLELSIHKKIPTALILMSSFVLYFFHCMEINHEMETTKRKTCWLLKKKKNKLNLFFVLKKSQFQIPGKMKNSQKSIFHFSKLCGRDECERHLVIFYSLIPFSYFYGLLTHNM